MYGITQPSLNPTNKLTAATVAAAAVSVGGLFLRNLYPEWYDPDVMLAITPIIAFGTGWLIRDRPNVVITESPEGKGG